MIISEHPNNEQPGISPDIRDDVEGHAYGVTQGDDVRGHASVPDDDVEGHVRVQDEASGIDSGTIER